MSHDQTFQEPFSTLSLGELLALGRLNGRRSLRAKWAFLALLPEIASREAYRREGMWSVIEYGAKKGGATEREVKDVMTLHSQIGQYWVLWRLLAMGAVGMSKLQRVAKWVTPENAAWWAEQLVKCTRAQLEALIAAVRARSTGEPKAANPAPDGSEDLGEAGTVAQSAFSVRTVSMFAGSTQGTPQVPADLATSAAAQSGSSGTRTQISDTAINNSKIQFIHLPLTPWGAKALRDLHALVERTEGPVELGELVERIIIEALERGAESARADSAQPQSRSGPPPAVRPPRRWLQVVYKNSDTGAQWLPTGGGSLPVEALPDVSRARAEAAPEVAFSDLRARALAAMIRHSQKFRTRTVGGSSDTASANGSERGLASTAATGPVVSTVADNGRRIPAAIEVYLAARSGGICENYDCSALARHFHHCDAYSESQTHDPDRMLALCATCHDGLHKEILVPAKGDLRRLVPVTPGSSGTPCPADEKYLAVKSDALEGVR
ncbi:MAG: hypothetical protein FJZ01_19770 [Candidatus Sericytochromatia bacterium]|nr:hypothetical protein [Candidatus Tanganyikabacteria bacterium]